MHHIVFLGINTVEVSHAALQVRIRGLDHQMVMCWHQTKGGHVDIKKFGCLLKQIYELLIISFIYKKICFPARTIHHMVPGIRIIYSQWTRHDAQHLLESIIKVNRRFDPYDFKSRAGETLGSICLVKP